MDEWGPVPYVCNLDRSSRRNRHRCDIQVAHQTVPVRARSPARWQIRMAWRGIVSREIAFAKAHNLPLHCLPYSFALRAVALPYPRPLPCAPKRAHRLPAGRQSLLRPRHGALRPLEPPPVNADGRHHVARRESGAVPDAHVHSQGFGRPSGLGIRFHGERAGPRPGAASLRPSAAMSSRPADGWRKRPMPLSQHEPSRIAGSGTLKDRRPRSQHLKWRKSGVSPRSKKLLNAMSSRCRTERWLAAGAARWSSRVGGEHRGVVAAGFRSGREATSWSPPALARRENRPKTRTTHLPCF